MATQKKNKQKSTTSKKNVKNESGHEGAGWVLGAAVAGAALSSYLLYGSKNASKNRKVVRSWALKAKGEVLERVEQMKEVNEGAYHKAVDAVVKKYALLKSVDTKEIEAMGKDLKKHWKNIEKDLKKKSKKQKK